MQFVATVKCWHTKLRRNLHNTSLQRLTILLQIDDKYTLMADNKEPNKLTRKIKQCFF